MLGRQGAAPVCPWDHYLHKTLTMSLKVTPSINIPECDFHWAMAFRSMKKDHSSTIQKDNIISIPWLSGPDLIGSGSTF